MHAMATDVAQSKLTRARTVVRLSMVYSIHAWLLPDDGKRVIMASDEKDSTYNSYLEAAGRPGFGMPQMPYSCDAHESMSCGRHLDAFFKRSPISS